MIYLLEKAVKQIWASFLFQTSQKYIVAIINTEIMLNQYIKMATFHIIILEAHSYSLYNNDIMPEIPSTKFYYPVVNSRSTTSDSNWTFNI